MRSQTTPTSGRRLAALVIAALLLGAASVGFDAATARAATIGRQETLRPPSHQPVEFAGRRYRMGAPIPRGHVVLRRRVTVRVGEEPRVTFTCPRKTVALSPAASEDTDLGFTVRNTKQYQHPRRVFALYAVAFTDATGGEAHGRLYLLCGPKGTSPR